mgnify:CR=1 FL=1
MRPLSLALALSLFGCSSILGLDDFKDSPATGGSAGGGGTGGSGGDSGGFEEGGDDAVAMAGMFGEAPAFGREEDGTVGLGGDEAVALEAAHGL